MEFKKLSNVEVVEAASDAATVLIEEDGVIKRAPKSEIGGGKPAEDIATGGGFDLVFYCNSDNNQASISHGSYEDFIDKCSKGIAPNVVLISGRGETIADGLIHCKFYYLSHWDINSEKVDFYFSQYGDEYINMYPDGSVEYSYIG